MRTRRYYIVRSCVRWTLGFFVFWLALQMLSQLLNVK